MLVREANGRLGNAWSSYAQELFGYSPRDMFEGLGEELGKKRSPLKKIKKKVTAKAKPVLKKIKKIALIPAAPLYALKRHVIDPMKKSMKAGAGPAEEEIPEEAPAAPEYAQPQQPQYADEEYGGEEAEESAEESYAEEGEQEAEQQEEAEPVHEGESEESIEGYGGWRVAPERRGRSGRALRTAALGDLLTDADRVNAVMMDVSRAVRLEVVSFAPSIVDRAKFITRLTSLSYLALSDSPEEAKVARLNAARQLAYRAIAKVKAAWFAAGHQAKLARTNPTKARMLDDSFTELTNAHGAAIDALSTWRVGLPEAVANRFMGDVFGNLLKQLQEIAEATPDLSSVWTAVKWLGGLYLGFELLKIVRGK